MRRLFQFSNLVWRISLENEGPKLVLEKGLTENCRDLGLVTISDCTPPLIRGIEKMLKSPTS